MGLKLCQQTVTPKQRMRTCAELATTGTHSVELLAGLCMQVSAA
jgi:hypothetical protein